LDQHIRQLQREIQQLRTTNAVLQQERDEAQEQSREIVAKMNQQTERSFELSLEVRHLREVAQQVMTHRSQIFELNMELTQLYVGCHRN
jgi:predicted  nucleic acid-binding Zn-ribbon protein